MAKLELQALLSISQPDLTKNLDQLLEEILTSVGHEMGAHSGSIMLVNEESDELEMVATFGLPSDYIDRVYSKGVPVTFSPSGLVLKSGKYYTVSNIFEESRDKPWMDLARELGFSAQLFMPMKRNGEVIGLLNIYMPEPHEFTNDEIAFVSIAANQAAAVIENARLYTKLRESEEFNSRLSNNSPNPIVVVNPDTSVRYVNPAFERLTRFSSTELIGKKAPYPWWTKERERQTHTDFETALSKGAYRLEDVFQKKNGERFCVEITSRPIKENGELKYYIANWVDITERKRIDTALQESEEKYRMLVENANEAIVVAQDRMLKFANSQTSKIMGYSQEELISKPFLEFIHPDDREMVHERYLRRLKGEEVPHIYSLRFIDKEGTTRWMEFNGVKFTWEGKPAVLTFLTDVTERKRAEEALQESEKWYRTLIQNSSDIIFVLDEVGTIRYMSPSVERIIGYKPEDMVGKNGFDYYHPEDIPTLHATFVGLTQQAAGTATAVARALRKDGSAVYLEIVDKNLLSDPQIRGVVGNCRDITERKLAEEKLRGNRELLSNILAASPIGIGLVEVGQGGIDDRKLGWTNESMLKIFGFEPGEEYYVGKSAEAIYASKEEYERVGKIFYENLQKGRLAEVEAKLKRKDGSLFDGHIRMSFLDPANPLKGAVAAISDITWRKQAEAELKDSEERLRILFEYAPDAYFLTDLEGTLVDGNKAAEELCGYTKEEVMGKNLFKLNILHPEHITKAIKSLEIRAQGQPAGPEEFILTRKDGKKRVVEIRTFPVKIKNDTLVLNIARDITGRKQVEDALLTKNRELEREIEKRKRIENALRLSERKYKEITEFLPDQIYESILILS